MKLGLKITLPILLLLMVVMGAFGYILYNLQQQETIIYTEESKIRILNGFNQKLAKQQDQTEYSVLAYRFNQDRASLVAMYQTELDKSKTLDEMYPFITSETGQELINRYINEREEIESLRNDLIRAIDNGDEEQISLNYNKWNIQTQNIKTALADIGAHNINLLEKTLVTVGEVRNKIAETIIVLVFIVIATVLFLFLYLRVIITNPVIKLAKFADEISNNNFTTIHTSTRKDELGILYRAFNSMILKIKESHESLGQKVKERTLALEQAKAKDEAILASIGDGLAVVDETGKLIYFNKNAEDIIGLGANQDLPKTWAKEYGSFDPISLKLIEAEQQPLFRALKGETVKNMLMFLKNPKMSQGKYLSVTATPILLDSKSIGGVAIFRDMTKEMEVDKAKTEFVSIASHQLRTPLTAVNWYSEILLDKNLEVSEDKKEEYLEKIHTGSARMVDLVNALLDASRIELGTLPFNPKPVNPEEVLQEVIFEQKQEIDKKKISFITNFTKDLPTVYTDREIVRMVFENLLSNAIKYTPDSGRVEVSLSLDDKGDPLIIFADTGYGIPKNDQSKIFDKMFRAQNIKEKDTEGTGLGLYIVKSALTHLGGQIRFESEENKGTTFYVTLSTKPK